MRREHLLPARVVCGIMVCGALIITGCTAEDIVVSESTTRGQVSLQFLTEMDVRGTDKVEVADLDRFKVTEAMSKHWARRYAADTGGFDQPLVDCFSYPVRDATGTLVARGYIFTNQNRCYSFPTLVLNAQKVWQTLGLAHSAEIDSAHLKRAELLSAVAFFTVEVRSHSFRHPLREAYRGLPEWVLRVSLQWPTELNDSCRPRAALLPEVLSGNAMANALAGQIVRYSCAEPTGEVVYSHDLGRKLDSTDLTARYLTVEGYTLLRIALVERYSGAALSLRLTEMRNLWTRYLADFTGGEGE